MILLLVISVSLSNTSTAQPPQKEVSADDEFVGKIVSIYHRDGGEEYSITLLEHVHVQRIGGVEFLTGECRGFKPEYDGAWRGVVMKIPVKNVETIILFENLETATKLLTTMSRGALKQQSRRSALPAGPTPRRSAPTTVPTRAAVPR
jgi:hypothetical protein